MKTRSARRAGEAAIAQTAKGPATAGNAPSVTARESARTATDGGTSLALDSALARYATGLRSAESAILAKDDANEPGWHT